MGCSMNDPFNLNWREDGIVSGISVALSSLLETSNTSTSSCLIKLLLMCVFLFLPACLLGSNGDGTTCATTYDLCGGSTAAPGSLKKIQRIRRLFWLFRLVNSCIGNTIALKEIFFFLWKSDYRRKRKKVHHRTFSLLVILALQRSLFS